jgi:glutaredoxin
MKELTVVVYTMKGCPHCVNFKEMLTNEGIEFVDRDTDEFEEEYKIFSEITDNDLIPALLIIEGNEKKNKSYLYTPDRDYDELTEAIEIIKSHKGKIL